VGFVGLCLLIGAEGGALLQHGARAWYLSLTPPPGTPPGWVFGPVWTALYIMIGTAAWLIWRRVGAGPALRLWGWQIAANALWAPAFFGLRHIGLGFAVCLLLLALTLATMLRFHRISRAAGWLMLPSVLWIAYASYLNLGFWWLNRH
jgi:benzodiazapine receptor